MFIVFLLFTVGILYHGILYLYFLHLASGTDHPLFQVTPAPPAKTSNNGGNVVSSGVVLAAAPTPSPALIDIGDNTDTNLGQQQTKSKKTKTHEKALLLSDDEFQ